MENDQLKKAVVLLSGGVDSSTVLALAVSSGFLVHAITFDYGQRQGIEIEAAQRISRSFNVREHKIVKVELRAIGGSALTDSPAVPKGRPPEEIGKGIPPTYVPARNLIFLSLALAYAEVTGARDIFWGANVMDYSGYPDCRGKFIRAFSKVASLATRMGVAGENVRINTPLIKMRKEQIIKLGTELGVDFSLTHSCYDPGEDGKPCGGCDACVLRRKGFQEAGLEDPGPRST